MVFISVLTAPQYLDLDSARTTVGHAQPVADFPGDASEAVLLEFAYDSSTPESCSAACSTLMWGPEVSSHRKGQMLQAGNAQEKRGMHKGTSWNDLPGTCFLDVQASPALSMKAEYRAMEMEKLASFKYSAAPHRYPSVTGG